jgi:hypothetical protein
MVPAMEPVSSWAKAGAANPKSMTRHASHAPSDANPRFTAQAYSVVRIEIAVISASLAKRFLVSRAS